MEPSTFDLRGASVLVVGASGGLGAPLAAALADRGALLTLMARDAARLRRRAPAGAVIVQGDLRDPSSPGDAVAAAVEAHGRLDGVVLIAGVVAFGPLADLTDETLDELVRTNLVGPIRLLRAALPHLRTAARSAAAGGGGPGSSGAFALTLSAVVAEAPVAGMAAYCATKAGLWGFDAAMARELRSARVRVIDARPPHTESGLATRPIAGKAPALPAGLDPRVVAERLVRGIEDGERDLPSTAFAGSPRRAPA